MKSSNQNHFKTALGAILISSVLFTACEKDKTEPVSPVSRLFVSNADASDPNLSVFSPADGASLGSPMQYNTSTPDGNGIVYDASSNVGFQVSRTNKTIKRFSVSSTGMVTTGTSFSDAALASGRDAAYDAGNKTLYVASNSDSTIRVYNNAHSLTGAITANKILKLNGQPWGITFANGSLMVLIDQDRKEIQLFNNINSIATGTVTPTSKITILAATRLHGLTYDASSDILIVTEIGLAAEPTLPTFPAFNADGGIYIIEGAMAKFTANSAVTATRTIIGANTMLGNPVDVTFDAREGKKLIYVAEKANKKILVFRLTDSGNVAPASFADVTTLPESIFVDAR